MYILHYPPIHHMTITQHFPTISQPFFPTAPGHWSARGRATRRGWRLACLGRRLRSNCQAGDGRRRGNGHERTSKNGRCLWMIIYNYMIFYYMIIWLDVWSWLIMIDHDLSSNQQGICMYHLYIYTSLSLVAFCRIWWDQRKEGKPWVIQPLGGGEPWRCNIVRSFGYGSEGTKKGLSMMICKYHWTCKPHNN